ncbi:MAG: hypothetical protein KGO03_08095, partial [Gemmatimonadota bacterium]|nr:hypothetical protein [Gemmatimonadota bacterium]
LALLAWGAAAGVAARHRVRAALDDGLGYAHDSWRRSAMLDWARGDGVLHPLYSNQPMFAYLMLGRPVRGLPPAGDTSALRAFAAALAAHGGAVLAFDAENPRFAGSGLLAGQSGLRVLATYESGRVLVPASP